MFKVLLVVLASIAAALVGGVYLNFNPAIPIFVISAASPAART
jgi:hypothetical protein